MKERGYSAANQAALEVRDQFVKRKGAGKC
jgi:hypothetical protein